MDRFIATYDYIPNIPQYNLKSNMDRFIEDKNELFRKENGI